MQDSRELPADQLPKELTLVNGEKRDRRPRWTQWELDFIEECFETTQHPTAWLRRIWALQLTEKKLRTMTTIDADGSDLENEEGLAWTWFSFYERRVKNWVKNKKTKLRRERKTSREGEHLDDVDDNPPASHTLPRRSVIHDSTPCETLSRVKGKKTSPIFHQSESHISNGSISPERDYDTCDTSGSARLKLEKLARFVVMQEELRRFYSTTESENGSHLAFPVSVCREEPYTRDEPM